MTSQTPDIASQSSQLHRPRTSHCAVRPARRGRGFDPDYVDIKFRKGWSKAGHYRGRVPGIMVTDGGDLQISGLQINLETGEIPPPTVHLRMDTWPYWLAEGVGAAIAAAEVAPITPALVAADSEGASRLMVAELRASMRALTSSAFAIDAFYASVKARSPVPPEQSVWHQKGTTRHKQVAATLRHHLQVKDNQASKELSKRVKEIFRFRDWAVHPGSQFREAIYRQDVDAGVDWHFVAFRASTAVVGVAKTVQLLDHMVRVLDRGSEDLVKWKPHARRAMNHVLDVYESSDKLLAIDRAEPLADGAEP
jgi:hypothetical protein